VIQAYQQFKFDLLAPVFYSKNMPFNLDALVKSSTYHYSLFH